MRVSVSGLPSSAAYGASKAGLINMCEALKPELDRHGVRLSLINPGFVETPLTDRNDFPMPSIMTVEQASSAIKRGIKKKQPEIHFPKGFTLSLKAASLLPRRLWMAIAARMKK